VLRFSVNLVAFLAVYALLRGVVSSPGLLSMAVLADGNWGLPAAWSRLPGPATFRRATEAYRRGRFGEAIETWSKALERFPTGLGPGAWLFRGMARLRLWQLRPAIDDLRSARRLARIFRREWLAGIDAELVLADALLGRDRRNEAALAARLDVGHGALIEALARLREGAFDAALAVLRSPEARQSSGTLGELVRVLEAWCHFELRREVVPVDVVSLFREGSGDELLAAWPGLARFLEQARAR
jgi:tetratricopeptide (TPR) repeat protein